MRVLLLDTDLTGLDLAYRAAEAGHDVRLYQQPRADGAPIRQGFGFPGIKRVSTWKDSMQWAKDGLIIHLFNEKPLLKALEPWRLARFPIFGPSLKSAELERNRTLGMRVMEEHDFDVPRYHQFTTLDAALAFAWRADQPYVFKTLGDEEDKSLSYVASDPADLVGWILLKKQQGLKLKGPCMLQERIDMVCEVGIAGWMGKEGFLPGKHNLNFEHKKLLAGDLGPSTGEEGTVCKYVEEGKLVDLLKQLEAHFMSIGHIGDTDIGLGIDTKGRMRPFELSMRFGWPSTQIVTACHTGDPVQWMRDAWATGEDTLIVDTRVAMGVVMSRPPYPTKLPGDTSSVGWRIEGAEEVWDHVSPCEMMIERGPTMRGSRIVEEPIYKTTGDYVCVVTAQGSDVHDVVPQVYAAADKIRFSDRQFRNDIGKRLEKEIPRCKALGFNEFPDW